MKIRVLQQPVSDIAVDWLVLPVIAAQPLRETHPSLADEAATAMARLEEGGDFSAKPGELVRLFSVAGIASERVLLVGLGSVEELTPSRIQRGLTAAVREVCSRPDRRVAIAIPATGDATRFSESAAIALQTGPVSPQLYRSEPERHPLAEAMILVDASTQVDACEAAVERGEVLGASVNLTRELVNRHPGELYPETFADRAAQVAQEFGIQCRIFDEPQLLQERMNCLLAVSAGSDRPPRMVSLTYDGGGDRHLVLVGKGVTFDSGGLSIKPSDSMKSMKADMAGAATVLGAIVAIARLGLPLKVTGLMGLVENMTGGRAYKLGEVLTARNGLTVEVLNTDAEGRLVLADVLDYATDLNPDWTVDLATLTGACVVALGEEVAGAFTNSQPLCDSVMAAASDAGEEIWQLPMFDSYAEQLKSEVADLKNIGTRWGGAITAAKFLERFAGEGPWVHLDIAGPSFAESARPGMDSGATGSFVRTLVALASRLADGSAAP